MSERVKRQKHFIKLLLSSTVTSKQRRVLIKNANREQVLALGEIALNVLQGHLVIPEHQRANLYPHRHALRQVAKGADRITWRDRHSLLVKHSKAIERLLQLAKGSLEEILQ